MREGWQLREAEERTPHALGWFPLLHSSEGVLPAPASLQTQSSGLCTQTDPPEPPTSHFLPADHTCPEVMSSLLGSSLLPHPLLPPTPPTLDRLLDCSVLHEGLLPFLSLHVCLGCPLPPPPTPPPTPPSPPPTPDSGPVSGLLHGPRGLAALPASARVWGASSWKEHRRR